MVGMLRPCVRLLAATKVDVKFGGIGMWRCGGTVVPDGLPWLWCRFCHAVHVQLGIGMLRAKALAGVAADRMTAALTSLSPLGASF